MTIMRFLVALFVTLATSLPAGALPLDCEEAITTREMLQCADHDRRQAEVALEDTLRDLGDSLDEKARDLLTRSQSAWEAYRDAECDRIGDMARGGTIAPLLTVTCLESLATRRSIDLQAGAEQRMTSAGPEVLWIPGQSVRGAFTCGGEVEARVGLRPDYDLDLGRTVLLGVVEIGDETLYLPIGGNSQGALCGADLSVEAVSDSATCPAVRVDDGFCDAFVFSWDAEKQRFMWDRN